MQLFSKNQKFIVEILEIRYIGHQIILLSNVFILLQFTQFLKKIIWQKKSAKHARLLQYWTFFLFPEEPLLSALWKGSIIGLFTLEFEGLETKSPFEAFEGQYGSNFKP